MERTTYYPNHLARLVCGQLRALRGSSPSESLLARLFETLYLASFRTDEGRRILCTVNFLEGPDVPEESAAGRTADRWQHTRFSRPLPLDVRTLSKLARAADPSVSSLTVFANRKGRLFIAGLVDQEPRHADYITLSADHAADRPGLFQATINGIGNISVYHRYHLIGSLVQGALVEAYHDVLWSGPLHDLLARHLHDHLLAHRELLAGLCRLAEFDAIEEELRLRWINSLSRVLTNIQQYRHGGGLLLTPHWSGAGLNVKYTMHYSRLMKALLGMVQAHLLAGPRPSINIGPPRSAPHCDELPEWHSDPCAIQNELEYRKREVLGAARFIASLASVDGVVLVDPSLAVRGFGVEIRTDNPLSEFYTAGDSHASADRLRAGELTQFGTRHRAMMRYCHQHPGAVGFVISQDGEIQTMTRLDERLVLWENIDVQLAFKGNDASSLDPAPGTVWRRINARAV